MKNKLSYFLQNFTNSSYWFLAHDYWFSGNGNASFHLGATLDKLVDLRFADDILLSANSGPEVVQFFHKLVKVVDTAAVN